MYRIIFKVIKILSVLNILLTVSCINLFNEQEQKPASVPLDNVIDENNTQPVSIDKPVITKISDSEYSDKVYIRWETDARANFHEIYRTLKNDSEYTIIGSSTINGYIDFNVKQGTIYEYYVRSGWKSPSGTPGIVYSENSDTKTSITLFVQKPQNVKATTDNTDHIVVSWDDIDAASKYNLYKSDSTDDPDKFKLVAAIDAPGNNFIYTPERTGKSCYFYVQAISSYNYLSPASDIVEGYIGLADPSGLTAGRRYYSVIKLKWMAVPFTRNYEIYCNNEKIATSVFTRYTDARDELVYKSGGDNLYEYSVRAVSFFDVQSEHSNAAYGNVRNPEDPVFCKFSWKRSNAKMVNGPGGGYKVYFSRNNKFNTGDDGVKIINVPYSTGDWCPNETESIQFNGPGSWYFKVSAYYTKNTELIESSLSNTGELKIE